MATSVSAEFAVKEAHLETRSSALRKELGFRDLVFACILLVVVPDFFGSAAKAGRDRVSPDRGGNIIRIQAKRRYGCRIELPRRL